MKDFLSGWLVLTCLAILSFGCAGEATPRPAQGQPKSFTECVAAGGAILKSYPAQCVSSDGMRFVDDEGAHQRKAKRGCKDLCGNGQCEEIVCMAIGCACAETHASCPSDCKE